MTKNAMACLLEMLVFADDLMLMEKNAEDLRTMIVFLQLV